MASRSRLSALRVADLAVVWLIALVMAACTAVPAGDADGGAGTPAASVERDAPGGEPAQETAGGVCSLVTRDEVQGAVDMVVEGWVVGEPDPGEGRCYFAATGDDEAAEIGNVQLRVTEDFPRESFEIVVDSFDGEPVPELGESAYWAESVMNLGVMLADERYLEVQVTIVPADGGHREAAIELAELAIARM